MNEITIFAPRWRDRKVLVADWKIATQNKITITARRADGTKFYPEPFVISGVDLQKYPIEQMPHGKMRAVALDDLLQLVHETDTSPAQ